MAPKDKKKKKARRLEKQSRSELVQQIQNQNSLIQQQALEIEGLKLKVHLKENATRSADLQKMIKNRTEPISAKNRKIKNLEKALDKQKKKVKRLEGERDVATSLCHIEKSVGKKLNNDTHNKQKAKMKAMKKVVKSHKNKAKLLVKRIAKLEISTRDKDKTNKNLKADYEGRINDIEGKVKVELEKNFEGTKKVKTLERDLLAKNEELTVKEAENSDLRVKILQLKDDNKKEIAELRNRPNAGEKELTTKKGALTLKVAEISDKNAEISNMNAKILRLKDDNKKVIAELEKRLNVSEQELSVKRGELAAKEAEINVKNAEILQMKDDIRKEIAELKNQLEAIEKELTIKKGELTTRESEINDKNAEILWLKDEFGKARDSHKTLDTIHTRLKEGLKSLLRNRDNRKNKKTNSVSATQASTAVKSSTKTATKRAIADNSEQTDVKKAKCAIKVSDDTNVKELAKSIPVDELKTLTEFCEKVKMEIKTSGCIKERHKCCRRSCDDCKQVIRNLFTQKSRELLELKVCNPAEAIKALRTQAFLNVTGYFPDSL